MPQPGVPAARRSFLPDGNSLYLLFISVRLGLEGESGTCSCGELITDMIAALFSFFFSSSCLDRWAPFLPEREMDRRLRSEMLRWGVTVCVCVLHSAASLPAASPLRRIEFITVYWHECYMSHVSNGC